MPLCILQAYWKVNVDRRDSDRITVLIMKQTDTMQPFMLTKPDVPSLSNQCCKAEGRSIRSSRTDLATPGFLNV